MVYLYREVVVKAPDRIYLQVAKTEEDDDWDDEVGVTWCVDRINDTDAVYVKAELHTLVACTVCKKRGVQNQHSVNGMCPTCAEAELERLRRIEGALLDGAPREEVAKYHRARAKNACYEYDRNQENAIADALEVKL